MTYADRAEESDDIRAVSRLVADSMAREIVATRDLIDQQAVVIGILREEIARLREREGYPPLTRPQPQTRA